MNKTISREELKAKIDRGDKFKLVETLPEEKFRESHLPGAVNLPPDQIQEHARHVLPDKNAETVVYCGSSTCTASEDAARALEAQGFTHVQRYVGGKKDWTDAHFPTESESKIAAATAS